VFALGGRTRRPLEVDLVVVLVRCVVLVAEIRLDMVEERIAVAEELTPLFADGGHAGDNRLLREGILGENREVKDRRLRVGVVVLVLANLVGVCLRLGFQLVTPRQVHAGVVVTRCGEPVRFAGPRERGDDLGVAANADGVANERLGSLPRLVERLAGGLSARLVVENPNRRREDGDVFKDGRAPLRQGGTVLLAEDAIRLFERLAAGVLGFGVDKPLLQRGELNRRERHLMLDTPESGAVPGENPLAALAVLPRRV
jgi:hypothetical protein